MNETAIPLEEGEHYVEENAGCCKVLKKVCSKNNCLPQEECSEHLVKIPDLSTNSSCCPKYKCGKWFKKTYKATYSIF